MDNGQELTRPGLDLDAAAAEIEKRRPTWAAAGFTVGDLTWRDRASGWPYPLVARADAKSPDAVGVSCIRGQVEFKVVLFDGWADVEGVNFETRVIESSAPGILDIAAFGVLLDEMLQRWDFVAYW